MKKACWLLLLSALTACTALPNPDPMAGADGARSLPEHASWNAELHLPPVLAEAPAELEPPTKSQQATSSPASHSIWLYLGGRSLNSDFGSVKEQGLIGVEYAFEPADSIVGLEVGLIGSYGDNLFLKASYTRELYAGAKKTFRRENTFRPHVGAGLSVINVEIEDRWGLSGDADDASLGGYVHGGGTWMLGKSFHLGVDLRTLFGTDLTFDGFDTDANYSQIALVLGWSI